MSVHLTAWQWIGVSVWLFFGFVAVTMIPSRPNLPLLARFAFFLFLLIFIAPFGLFAFALAMDAKE